MTVRSILLLTGAFALGAGLSVQPQETEPPLEIRIRGLGDDRVVSVGETFEVALGGESRSVTLELLSTRELCLPDVCLRYPSEWLFEFEEAPGVKIWTLEGSDAVILAQRLAVAVDLDEFAREVADGIAAIAGEEVGWQEAPRVDAPGLALEGTRFVAPLGEFELRTNVYAVFAGERRATTRTFLVVQEVMERGEPTSAELERFLDLLATTLRRS